MRVKRSFKVLCVMALILMSTGCVKMEIGMDINKDKSMNLSVIEAVNNDILKQSDTEPFDQSQLDEIKKQGYKVEEYTEDSMSGYKFTKKVDSIDTVSTKDKVEGDLSILSGDKDENKYLFTVKQGLFKNTYSAKLKSSDVDSMNDQVQSATTNIEDTNAVDETNDDSIDVDIEDDTIIDNQTEDNATNDEIDSSFSQDMDLSALSSSMEMKFTVNLPYKAISNNATSVDNDGKKLTWNLLTSKEENIEFEFELYNMTNIYIAAGVGALLLILIIIFIIKKGKGKKNKPLEEVSVVEQLNSVQPADIDTMPAQPNTMNMGMPNISNEVPTTVEDAVTDTVMTQPEVEQMAEPVITPSEQVTEMPTQNPQPIEPTISETVTEKFQMGNSVNNVEQPAETTENSVESLDIFNNAPDDINKTEN